MPPLDTGGGFYIPLIAKENKVFFAQKEVYGLNLPTACVVPINSSSMKFGCKPSHLGEHLTVNQGVTGSSPVGGAKPKSLKGQ